MAGKSENYPEIDFTRPVRTSEPSGPWYDLRLSHKEVKNIYAEITKPNHPEGKWKVKLPNGSEPKELALETLDQAVEQAANSIMAHRQLLSFVDEYATEPESPKPRDHRRQSAGD